MTLISQTSRARHDSEPQRDGAEGVCLYTTLSSSSPMAAANSIINCKLLLIGNSSVGKSSLLMRFSDEQWLPEDEASATIGVDFRVSRRTPSFWFLMHQ